MNLAELADLVCETVRKPDSDSLAACKTYLKRRDQMLWDGNLWRDSLFTFTKTVGPTMSATDAQPLAYGGDTLARIRLLAATGFICLEQFVDVVLAVRKSNGPLPVQNVERYFLDSLDAFAQTGDPVEFSLSEPVAWQSYNDQQLFLVSSGADTAVCVVHYIDTYAGVLSKQVTLSSTTPVAFGYGRIVFNITKPPTSGNVMLQGGDSVVENTFAVLSATETEARQYQRLLLLPAPTADLTLRFLVKKRYVPLAGDYESPRLRKAENVLIAYATGDMLRRSNKFGMANEAYAEGAALLAKLENIEFFQQAQRMQLVPEIEGNGFGSDVDFAGGTKGYW